jgi:hypothetical protein
LNYPPKKHGARINHNHCGSEQFAWELYGRIEGEYKKSAGSLEAAVNGTYISRRNSGIDQLTALCFS